MFFSGESKQGVNVETIDFKLARCLPQTIDSTILSLLDIYQSMGRIG